MFRYFAIHKPFGMLSQFTRDGNNESLSDLNYEFPKDAYPIGRLDSDSEGLLLLSNDGSINKSLLDPEHGHWRSYLVQVEGSINEEACQLIRAGIIVNINGKPYKSIPCKAKPAPVPTNIAERVPPVRFRKNIPTSWMLIEMREGKNRQVRKMTAAAGFPTLRLMRVGIEGILLGDMKSGDVIEFEKADFLGKLKLN